MADMGPTGRLGLNPSRPVKKRRRDGARDDNGVTLEVPVDSPDKEQEWMRRIAGVMREASADLGSTEFGSECDRLATLWMVASFSAPTPQTADAL